MSMNVDHDVLTSLVWSTTQKIFSLLSYVGGKNK